MVDGIDGFPVDLNGAGFQRVSLSRVVRRAILRIIDLVDALDTSDGIMAVDVHSILPAGLEIRRGKCRECLVPAIFL